MFSSSLATQKTFAKLSTRHGRVLEAPLSVGGVVKSGQDKRALTEKREKLQKPFRGAGVGREGRGQAKPTTAPPLTNGDPQEKLVGEVFHLPSV